MRSSKRGTIPADQLQPVLRLFPRAVRFWRTGVVVAAVLAVAAVATVVVLPKRYKSEAVVLYREGMQWRPDESGSPRRVGQRLRDILLARTNLAKVIEELNLFPALVAKDHLSEAVEEMRLRTSFRFDQGEIFAIAYLGDTPEEAKKVTQKLVDLLTSENSRLRTTQAELARQFLDSEKKRMEKELVDKEAEQLRYLAKHPELATEQANIGVSLRSRRRTETTNAAGEDAALAALRRDEARLQRQLAASGESVAPSDTSTLLAARTDAETKLREARRDLADRRARFTEKHPDVRAAEARVAEAEVTFRKASEALVAAEKQTGLSAETLRDRLAKIEAEISRRERIPVAEPVVERSESARLGAVAVEAEWTRLSREVAEARERLQNLDSQQFTASMTASMVTSGQTAQLILVDPPNLPAAPDGMNPKRLSIVGSLAAVVLGFLVMVVLAILDDLVYDRTDVERLEFAPVLGELPRLALPASGAKDGKGAAAAAPAPPLATPERAPEQPAEDASTREKAASLQVEYPAGGGAASSAIVVVGSNLPATRGLSSGVNVFRVATSGPVDREAFMAAEPHGAAAAAFRILRHRLRGYDARIILVTSPRTGEGKTVTALNLALALAEAGSSPVLLVEANHRNACVARMLGFTPPVPFDEQVEQRRNGSSEPWAVVETTQHRLHVLALAPGAAARPFQGPALAQSLLELREAGYQHIVVDGPNVLEGAEVNAIEESVDGVLLSLRTRKSRALEVRKVAEQIGFAKLLGVVLLGT
jgi:Mrp family chromosome partitioning ATPase/uncharacterized protein involved in exopolysaccharide biosynthesis